MAILTLQITGGDDSLLIKEIAQVIKNGGIAVIPTDTIYAISGSALKRQVVEKIYKLRKRTSVKPMIILVSSLKQIQELGIKLSEKEIEFLSKLTPNPLSFIVDSPLKNLHYLHRGKKTLAFRIPDNLFLQKLLSISGPVVAPSANFEGMSPALNIDQAKKYFKNSVPLYVDSGPLKSKPSTLVSFKNLKLTVLRQGAFKIPKDLLK